MMNLNWKKYMVKYNQRMMAERKDDRAYKYILAVTPEQPELARVS